MALNGEGFARKEDKGTAVSSGESSAAVPKPALSPTGAPSPASDGSEATALESPALKPDSSDAQTIVGQSQSDLSPSVANSVFRAIGATVFEDGAVLGDRYEILKLLGMGGMGAVYKARDQEVDRVVGLKVIRPDLAGNQAILARFKQELVLARQVTHRNIIRIYDLNEADGVKFITMEFVEGEDLRSILSRQKKLTPDEAVSVILQSCAGLQAIHNEGVIHRDLKPSNIMRDGSGRIVIMDFGLAKTVEGDGMTQTGMMIGTMEYMSPEQAMGAELDVRSDIFALGLIFYELLAGYIPFKAESAIASLVKRTQERATPLVEVDSSIPPVLSQIVAKCLEKDPAARYPSAQELIYDLEVWQGKRSPSGHSVMRPAALSSPGSSATVGPAPVTSASSSAASAPALPAIAATPSPKKWILIGVAALLLIAAGAGVWLRWHPGGPTAQSAQGPVMSLAIVPYYNATADPSLNWMGSSISESLSSDMGQSSLVRMVSPGRLQQVLRDLHISAESQLDQSTLRRIAEFTNADTVVFGEYLKVGEQIRINSTVLDIKRDRNLQITTDLSGQQDLVPALDKLADDVREKLGASPEVLKDLQAHSQRVPTKSVEALRAYNEGLQMARSGDNTHAAEKFEQATSDDPNFALAYARLAETYSKMGFDDKAEQTSRKAVALSDNLSGADRYLIQANHARVTNDTAKAIQAYENLTKVNPDDLDAQFALANLYVDASRFDDARKRLQKILDADPKNIDAMIAMAKAEITAKNPQASLEVLNRAYSYAVQFDNPEKKSAILQLLGIAYQDLDKPQEALDNLQKALTIRRQLNQPKLIASTLNQIAQLQATLGQNAEALASYKEALTLFRQIGDKKGTAAILINLGTFYNDRGKYADARPLYNEALQIERDLGNEAIQALCLNNLGTIEVNQGNFQAGLAYHQQALGIREKLNLQDDVGESLHNLAETNIRLGQYDTAMEQALKSLQAYRAAKDDGGVALVSSVMATLFSAQGQYARALAAEQDAVKILKQENDRSADSVEALGRYGAILSEMGRGDEGQKSIEEALGIAGGLKNDSATSLALNWLGDSYFYRGDFNNARQQYEKALQLANKSGDKQRIILSKFNLAKLDVMQGHSQAAVAPLKKVEEDADTAGLKLISVQASSYLAQALLATNKPGDAQKELDKALNRSEKLGLLVEQARAKYLAGELLLRVGKPKEAVPEFREAVRILESLTKEDGASHLLERADLKEMYREAAKAYQGGA